MRKLTLLLFISTILMGCSGQTFIADNNATDTGVPRLSIAQTFFFGGLFQSEYINASKVCGRPENVSRVETVLTPGNWFATLLTFSIYSPRRVNIYCKSRIS